MTFILTELNDYAIIMAADSSESYYLQTENPCFKKGTKIEYFSNLNIGISTWGHNQIEQIYINDWLKEKISEFEQTKEEIDKQNKYLRELSEYLAEKLNSANSGNQLRLGLHVAGYTYSMGYGELRPGVFHVHNHNPKNVEEISKCNSPEHRTGDPTKFIAEKSKPILPKGGLAYHLRNGAYQEFSKYYPYFQKLQNELTYEIHTNYRHSIANNQIDLPKVFAKRIGSWVSLVSNTFSEAGLLPVVGKDIRILVLLRAGCRKFTLPDISAGEWSNS